MKTREVREDSRREGATRFQATEGRHAEMAVVGAGELKPAPVGGLAGGEALKGRAT